ncbi:MAG: Bax inhibitor-1/YccA family protein, partial [Microbacterium arborescens]
MMFGLHSAKIAGIPLGLIIGVLVVIMAAYSLVLDLRQHPARRPQRRPRQFGWVGAFGIMVTVVWLYVEILRIIAILRGNTDAAPSLEGPSGSPDGPSPCAAGSMVRREEPMRRGSNLPAVGTYNQTLVLDLIRRAPEGISRIELGESRESRTHPRDRSDFCGILRRTASSDGGTGARGRTEPHVASLAIVA